MKFTFDEKLFKFAKVFNTVEFGQIMIRLDSLERGSKITFYFLPDDQGICEAVLPFDSPGEACRFFEGFNKRRVADFVRGIVETHNTRQ